MSLTNSVLVLGMHRSGTSALAGSLQEQGLFLGQVYENNPYNKKGNRENAEIMQLNESLLVFNGGSWDNPPDSIAWSSEHEAIRNQIINKFIESDHSIWGFKDPRTLVTMKFWLDGLTGNTNVRFVGSFRNPRSVASSLLSRNKKSFNKSVRLWEAYNIRLLKEAKANSCQLVSFDVGYDEYQDTIHRIASKLGLEYHKPRGTPFFDDSLRNKDVESSPDILSENIIRLFNELIKIYTEQSK
jgi:hypothetical protein